MFSNKSFVKVWRYKKSDRGNYYEVELSSSRKKEDGSYEQDFASKFVRFVGKAAEKIETVTDGAVIQITNCGVTNFYSKEKNREYVNYVVFDFELPDGSTKTKSDPAKARDAAKGAKNDDLPEHTPESDLPF